MAVFVSSMGGLIETYSHVIESILTNMPNYSACLDPRSPVFTHPSGGLLMGMGGLPGVS